MKLRVLLSMLLTALLLVSCTDPITEIESGISEDALDRLGAAVGTTWENRASTNISQSIDGNTDSKDIANPVVIKEGNTYKMWYSGKGVDNKWRVIYATSEDGKSWTTPPSSVNPVLRPHPSDSALDRDGTKVVTVIYDSQEKRYKMWYIGYVKIETTVTTPGPPPTTETVISYQQRLFFAKSNDGVTNWVKYPNDTPDQVTQPEPILTVNNPGGGIFSIDNASVMLEYSFDGAKYYPNYYIWYSYINDSNINILHSAQSINGTNWSARAFGSLQNADFYLEGIKSPVVIRDYIGNVNAYKLWFIGSQANLHQVGYAISESDGIFFNYYNPERTPIISPGEPGEADNIHDPWVIRDGNKYIMWLIGEESNRKAIFYRESLNY